MRLSGKDRRALQFIDDFTTVHGYPPTFEQVGAAIGWESKASTSHSLHKLRRAGLLDFEDGKGRTLHLTEKARA